MSDKIEARDVQYGLEMAWHNKTKVVESISREIVYPWNVVLAPMSYIIPGVETPTQHGKWVLPLADDDMLPLGNGTAVNLNTYTLRTPKQLWELRDVVVKDTSNTVVSAGSVQNRAKFFISTRLNDLARIKLQDGSEVELLLNSMGSMDKSLNEQHSISATRIVCYNTLMMSFLNDKIAFKYRHSKRMDMAIEQDEPLLQVATGAADTVGAAFNTLLNYDCTVDRAERIYTGLIVSEGQEKVSARARNMIEEHVACFQRGDGNAGKTEFDLLNGWTQPKTRGYQDSDKDTWSTFETSEFGAYANQKVKLAIMLLKHRTELAKIEARGRELLTIPVVAIA